MASIRVSGVLVSGAGDRSVYTGRGRLLGLLLSHKQDTVEEITIKDNATTLAIISIHPYQCPIYISFGPGEPTGGKQEGIPFTTSLVINVGDVNVNVWYLGY